MPSLSQIFETEELLETFIVSLNSFLETFSGVSIIKTLFLEIAVIHSLFPITPW